MAYTISTHNGHTAHRGHNRRDKRIVSKEPHIDPNGIHETWLDIDPREAYHQIFDEAIKEYNDKQKKCRHPERIIPDYYEYICKDPNKHPVYEMIVSVGSKNNHPDEPICKEILKEFVKDWQDSCPTLKLVGIFYHGTDESTPHLHLDYLPVAEMKRGPRLQNSLSKALEQMDYFSISHKKTAQMAWERNMNRTLERICQEHGLDIIHPKQEKRKHLEKEDYILQQLDAVDRKTDEAIDQYNDLVDKIAELNAGAIDLAYSIVASYEQEHNSEQLSADDYPNHNL